MYQQPNSANCFVCGLTNPVGPRLIFYDNGVDEVHSRYRIPSEFESYPGIAHGGILATLLDELAARVPLIDRRDRLMVTARMEVRYREPVPVNAPLSLVGRRVWMRGRLVQAACEIRLSSGAVAVEAEVTLVDPRPLSKGERRLPDVEKGAYP